MSAYETAFIFAAPIAMVAGFFVGDWRWYLVTMIGLVAGVAGAHGAARVVVDRFYRWLKEVLEWQDFETRFKTRLAHAITKKTLYMLPDYLYVIIGIYFINQLDHNVHKMALLWFMVFAMLISLSLTTELLRIHSNSHH